MGDSNVDCCRRMCEDGDVVRWWACSVVAADAPVDLGPRTATGGVYKRFVAVQVQFLQQLAAERSSTKLHALLIRPT